MRDEEYNLQKILYPEWKYTMKIYAPWLSQYKYYSAYVVLDFYWRFPK